MKKLALSLMLSLLAWTVSAGGAGWITDHDAALAQAKKEKKVVLVDFTGSDWCGWCIKLNKDVFSQDDFKEYAKKNLVLVELDFPRGKKQSDALKKANEKLQEKYAVSGFPTLIALDGDGKELWRQVGYMAGGPKAWIAKLDSLKQK